MSTGCQERVFGIIHGTLEESSLEAIESYLEKKFPDEHKQDNSNEPADPQLKEYSASNGEEISTYNFPEYGQAAGAWMFEVIVQSADLIRVGWSSESYIENEDRKNGVGTYLNSFSVEGHGKFLWVNGSSMEINSKWVPGDVITSCINFNTDTLNFYRNGRPLCPSISPGLVKGRLYTPCISLGAGGRALVNLGELPFIYSISDYKPFSQCPNSKIKCLDGPIKEKIEYFGSCAIKATLHSRDCKRCDKEKHKWIISCAIGHYADIIKKEGKSFTTLQLIATNLCKIVAEIVGTEDGNLTSTFFAELKQSFDKSDEDKELYGWIFAFTLRYFGILYKVCPTHIMIRDFLGGVSPNFYDADGGPLVAKDVPPAISFIGPRSLEAISYMLNFADVPEYPLSGTSFGWIDDALSVREHTFGDVDGLYPCVWWQIDSDAQPEIYKTISAEASKRLETAYELARNYQLDIIQFLYEHGIMHKWFTELVNRSMGYRRTVVPPGLPSEAMLANVFHVCARFVCQCGILEDSHKEKGFPPVLLYGMDGMRGDLERVGGNTSHLLKENCEKVPPIDSSSVPPTPWIIVDALATLFSLVESRRIAKLMEVSTELEKTFSIYRFLVQANSEAIESGDSAKAMTIAQILGNIKIKIEQLLKRRTCLIDFMSSRAEQDAIVNIMKLFADIIAMVLSSNESTDLIFLPQSYFDATFGIYMSLRGNEHVLPMLSVAEQNGALYSVLDIAAMLIRDKRIVNPTVVGLVRAVIIGALRHTDGPEFRVLSASSSSSLRKKIVVNALMCACNDDDNDDYVLDICKVLVDILSPENNDPMQDIAMEFFSSNKDTFFKYCDKLLDLLNLMLSSFEVALNYPFTVPTGESASVSERTVDEEKILPAVKKIVFTIENSDVVVRGLSSISRSLPLLFWGRELNYSRICEVIGFVFGRMRPGSPVSELFTSLRRVMEEHNQMTTPPLTVMLIIIPFIDITASLWKYDGIEAVYRFKRAEVPSSNFVWAISETNEKECPELPSFVQFCDACSRINDGSTLDAVSKEGALTPLEQAMSMESLDDENLCEICFSNKIDTEFVPCGHRSCKACIERHMVTDQSCFFCKAHVDSFHKL